MIRTSSACGARALPFGRPDPFGLRPPARGRAAPRRQADASPGVPGPILPRNGFAEARCKGWGLRFGPGSGLRLCTEMRGTGPEPPGESVYLCAFTPFDHRLEFTIL